MGVGAACCVVYLTRSPQEYRENFKMAKTGPARNSRPCGRVVASRPVCSRRLFHSFRLVTVLRLKSPQRYGGKHCGTLVNIRPPTAAVSTLAPAFISTFFVATKIPHPAERSRKARGGPLSPDWHPHSDVPLYPPR